MARHDHQLALSLTTPCGWGGRRPNAGRKPGPDPRIRHRSRGDFRRTSPAHVTVRVVPGLPSLRTVRIVHAVERTFAKGCARQGFRLVHYSLQGNHAHLIVEARDRDALGRGMMAIGARLARAVNRTVGRSGRVLADRYHVRLLPTPREVRNALRYVLLNARRHAAAVRSAMTRAVRLDPASSARWFDGWRRKGSEVGDADDDGTRRRSVARPRTWLLTVGWRRHGLLDPGEVPG
jgi:REP element-mobilizing transposase RayT